MSAAWVCWLPWCPSGKEFTCQRRSCCCCCEVASVVSDSVRPQRRQPTRIPRRWDSPGKNTGVGCHFLLQCMKMKVKVKSLSCVQLFRTPWTAAHQAPPSMGFSRQEYWSGLSIAFSSQRMRGRFIPWVRKIPWRRKWQPTLVFLPGKSHGWRSLVGNSL